MKTSQDGKEQYYYNGKYFDPANGDLVVYRGKVHQKETFVKEHYNPAIGETKEGLSITYGEKAYYSPERHSILVGKKFYGKCWLVPAKCVKAVQDDDDETESMCIANKPLNRLQRMDRWMKIYFTLQTRYELKRHILKTF